MKSEAACDQWRIDTFALPEPAPFVLAENHFEFTRLAQQTFLVAPAEKF
jgi:hypothetical protein